FSALSIKNSLRISGSSMWRRYAVSRSECRTGFYISPPARGNIAAAFSGMGILPRDGSGSRAGRGAMRRLGGLRRAGEDMRTRRRRAGEADGSEGGGGGGLGGALGARALQAFELTLGLDERTLEAALVVPDFLQQRELQTGGDGLF